jgi:uncharacterized membrane protein
MNDSLSFRDALATGWKITKSRFPLLLGYIGTLMLLGGVRYLIDKPIESVGIKAVIGIGFQILNWFLTFNALAVSLKLVDDQEVAYVDFWRPQSNFWFYVLATLLYGLVIGLGTLLLIVPGIILGLMLMFYGYVMIEKKRGPIQAFKESKRLTDGVKWDLFLFSLLVIGLNLLGFLALFVGVLVTMTVTFIAMAHLYRQRARALESIPTA